MLMILFCITSVDDLKQWEKSNGPIPKKAVVFMYSGWGKHYSTPMYNNFINDKRNVPSFSAEACRFLANERDIVGVGVDTGSVDGGDVVDYPAHVILQSANLFNIENGANFDKLPATGALITMMPLSLEGGSGCQPVLASEFPLAKERGKSSGPMQVNFHSGGNKKTHHAVFNCTSLRCAQSYLNR